VNQAAAEPQVEVEPQVEEPRQPKRWAVVILNDDDHTFPYVATLIKKVFHYQDQKCLELTLQVHEEGRAVVWTGALEHAEFKREQLLAGGPDYGPKGKVEYPLGVDLEPVD